MQADPTHGVRAGDWRMAPPTKAFPEPQIVLVDGFRDSHVEAIGVITEGPWRGRRARRFDETAEVATWPLVTPTPDQARIVWEWYRNVALDDNRLPGVIERAIAMTRMLAIQWPTILAAHKEQERG